LEHSVWMVLGVWPVVENLRILVEGVSANWILGMEVGVERGLSNSAAVCLVRTDLNSIVAKREILCFFVGTPCLTEPVVAAAPRYIPGLERVLGLDAVSCRFRQRIVSWVLPMLASRSFEINLRLCCDMTPLRGPDRLDLMVDDMKRFDPLSGVITERSSHLPGSLPVTLKVSLIIPIYRLPVGMSQLLGFLYGLDVVRSTAV